MRFLDEFGNVVDVDLGQVKIKDKETPTMQVKANFYLDEKHVGTYEYKNGYYQYNQKCGSCTSLSPTFCNMCNAMAEEIQSYSQTRESERKFREAEIKSLKHKLFNETELNKEEKSTTMQVTYKGFTGELVKLEKTGVTLVRAFGVSTYDLSIYDNEKQVTHSFSGVKIEDVNFIGVDVALK